MRKPSPTRLVFHAMFGIAVAIAVTGTALGVEARVARTEVLEKTPRKVEPHVEVARMVPIEQTVAPPLPVAPRFAASVAAGSMLSWRLEDGTDGARVELCPTRDFDAAKTRRIDVTGEEVNLPSSWPAGVWYWRLRGRRGSLVGDRTTPTWMVYVSDGNGPS